jgi:hypothetical protein
MLMRRSNLLALLMLTVLWAGCASNEPDLGGAAETTEEPEAPPAELLSSVHMSDAGASAQLLRGFHALEQGTWRWTEQRFAVALKAPPLLQDQPLHLTLKFTLPEALMEKQKTLTLSATVNGTPVGSETYDKAGDHVFSKPVPNEALAQEPAEVVFELDKALAGGELDARELGLVAVLAELR